MNTTRRAFLGGLLTLATIPQLHAQPSGLTPLETAVENLRQAYLRKLLFGGQAETSNILKAVQAHRALGLSGRDRIMTMRLAFRMAGRDYRLLQPNTPLPTPVPAALRELSKRRVEYLMEQAT